MFEAVLVDFYGTIVHEDDLVISAICETISASTSESTDPREIGRRWRKAFADSFVGSHGSAFRCQRELVHESLLQTIDHFSATSDAGLLSEQMFQHWSSAPVFADALLFLEQVAVPVAVLSNSDRVDIDAAIAPHRMRFTEVITGEDVRAYKPHRTMFEAGLRATGITEPSKVLHVGDSLTSDVEGANRFGLPVAWLNRTGKVASGPARPDHVVTALTELLPLFHHAELRRSASEPTNPSGPRSQPMSFMGRARLQRKDATGKEQSHGIEAGEDIRRPRR